jgi:hypothetical protein
LALSALAESHKESRFEKLSDDNWPFWKMQMEAYLEEKGLWRVIELGKEREKMRMDVNETDRKAWDIKWSEDERACYNKLVQRVGTAQLVYITPEECEKKGSIAWELLKRTSLLALS